MELDIEIGATIRSWKLGADNSLDVWVRQCPWRSGEVSQIRTVRIASQYDAERVMLELRRLVYASDEGVYSPKVLLSDQSETLGITGALTACVFGVPRRLDSLSLKRLILDRLNQAPHVFQIVDRSGNPTGLLEDLRIFVEDINREECIYPLIVLVLSEAISVVGRLDCFDTVPSMPSARILNPHDLDPGTIWANYLHSRAAWECGGDIHLAQIYGTTWKGLPQFDDHELETSCQSLATWRLGNVNTRREAEFRQYFVDGAPWTHQFGQGNSVENLIQDGLLWRAPGHCRLMPTAWAVRATATKHSGGGALQRAALVNAVLVGELLAWCFQLETLERARYFDDSDLSESEEAKTLYTNFIGKRPYSAAALYPSNYPFPPSIPDFESFGGFCNRLGKNPRTYPRRLLLSLRNALCHGHYAGWRAIEILLEIHSRLSFTPFSS